MLDISLIKQFILHMESSLNFAPHFVHMVWHFPDHPHTAGLAKAVKEQEKENRGRKILLTQIVSNLKLLNQPLNQTKKAQQWFNQCIM